MEKPEKPFLIYVARGILVPFIITAGVAVISPLVRGLWTGNWDFDVLRTMAGGALAASVLMLLWILEMTAAVLVSGRNWKEGIGIATGLLIVFFTILITAGSYVGTVGLMFDFFGFDAG